MTNSTKYEARINSKTLYTFIVRIDHDGEENVLRGYEGRHFANMKNAQKSTAAYITKFCG